MSKRILIVEDERPISNLIDWNLTSYGYSCQKAYDGLTAADLITEHSYDLVLLDIMLPGIDGYSLLEQIKPTGTPVIFLTAKGSVADRVQGLRAGADDYLVKPFSMKELDARLRALVRRAQGRQTRSVLRWEDIELDPAAHSATRSGVPLRLSPTGFVILETLLRAAPTVVPRTELEQAIWGDSPPDSDALRTHIHELRQKLDKPFTCPLLKTIPHVGYTLVRHE